MTHASVFSGIGGSEVAAAMLGWRNLFHCEINAFGRAVLEYWFPNSKSYEDITTTDFSEWRGRIGVLTGGFPCQPFSYAGKRGGASDDRYLWPYMFRCIDQVQPRWVVAENVAGILTMVEQGEVSKVASQAALFDSPDSLRGHYQLRETFTLQRICDDLEGHGYEVQPVLIPACSVGAPHRRDRVFIVGHRCDANTLADTNDTRLEGMHESRNRTQRPCTDGNAADTDNIGLWRWCSEDRNEWQDTQEDIRRELLSQFERYNGDERCGERWCNFPSVSPVHRGNDGLPFPLDHLTLSPGKWRTEALKAYGNAIVPQVMYEIFRAIEDVEQNNKS